MWISLYFLAVVGGLLPVASPSTNGLASSSFMAETTRWVSLKGLQLLELVKAKREKLGTGFFYRHVWMPI